MAKEKESASRPTFDRGIAVSKYHVAGVPMYGADRKPEPTIDEILDDVEREEARNVQKAVVLAKLREKMAQLQPEPATASSPKKYLVDPTTGRIDVVEVGEGEYTRGDALLQSASIRSTQGPSQYDNVVELLRAFKELTDTKEEGAAKPPEKPKEYYVDEAGVIVRDSENGEYTLSEARAISQSRQRAFMPGQQSPKEFYVDDDTGFIVHDPQNGELTLSEARTVSQSRHKALGPMQQHEPITPDKLELWKRDILDETRKELAARPKEEASPFLIDKEGHMDLNPNANAPVHVFLLYQLMQQMKEDRKHKETAYQGSDGSVRPLPEWLDLKRWEREEERKDQRNDAVMKLMEEGRKELPGLIQGLKGLSRSKESTEAMERGGWLESKDGQQGQKELPSGITAMCSQCGGKMSISGTPALVTCGCGTLNFIGNQAEFEAMREQLAPAVESPQQPDNGMPQESIEEKQQPDNIIPGDTIVDIPPESQEGNKWDSEGSDKDSSDTQKPTRRARSKAQ